MDDATPPTEHVLRPHHIALLTVFALAFQENLYKKFPAPYNLHLYRLLLNETSEVAQPKPYHDLIEEVATGPRADAEECRTFIETVRSMSDELESAERMANFFGNQTSLFVEKSEEEPAVFTRRSIFGYFCRRCFVSFLKLSFAGVMKLQRDYQLWVAGDAKAGYEPIEKDNLSNSHLLIFKTQADKKVWAKPTSYEAWEKGLSVGDENLAAENLRRFFEQHFHENNDSGLRQHALLNLVRMHYVRNEYDAAKKLLAEAITVARTSGDRATLQHCISLLHRLPPVSGRKPILNEIQPDLHPLEILFDVQKLLDEQNDQPISAAFARIVQSVALYDHWLDVQLTVPIEEEQWAQHAVQSIVWRKAGCERLATLEENVVIAFVESGAEDSNKITIMLNKAYKKARQGKYEGSLAMLLEPDVWRGLPLHHYASWANEIWHIMTLRATRRGQHRLYREVLLPQRPDGAFNPKEYFFDTKGPAMTKIREAIFEVLQMRQHNQATIVLEHLLKALWHTEFLGHLHEYRTCIILLADVGIEFGMSKRCRSILEEILPQVIQGDDVEQRAAACFALARCILIAENSTPEALREALPYLSAAEQDFRSLEMYRCLMDVQYMMSIVYHNLGMECEREEAANRHSITEECRRQLEVMVPDNEVQQILELVSTIGASLASR